MISSTVIKTQAGIIKQQLNQPFRTALGTHDILENVGFILTLGDKTQGYGEAAVAEHITGESLTATLNNLQSTGRWLEGQDIRDYFRISFKLRERLEENKSVLAAVETAILDALTRQWEVPLWRFFGECPITLQTDITVVIADLKETESTVKKYYKKGFRAFKVKIGKDFDLDVKRCLSVKRLAPKSAIYLDANQGYSASKILRFLKELKRIKVSVDLLEQPVARVDFEGLKKVSQSTKIPVCADESVRSLKEAAAVIQEQAADVINIKLMKFGMFEAREIALLARANNVPLMIGGMMETALAMTAGAHMAAGLGCFQYIDLDTPFFIKGKAALGPCLSSGGKYDLKKVKRGIGVPLKIS